MLQLVRSRLKPFLAVEFAAHDVRFPPSVLKLLDIIALEIHASVKPLLTRTSFLRDLFAV